jgi:hypothetical protein
MIKGVHTTFATKEMVEMCWIGYTSFNVPSLFELYLFFPHVLTTKDALGAKLMSSFWVQEEKVKTLFLNS